MCVEIDLKVYCVLEPSAHGVGVSKVNKSKNEVNKVNYLRNIIKQRLLIKKP